MCSRRVALAGVRRRPRKLVGGPVLSFGNSSITCSINRTHERLSFEHKSERATERKARQMTILDTREDPADTRRSGRCARSAADDAAGGRGRTGPAGAPLRYRGTGVLMSRASHRRRPITPPTTVVLALVAAGDHGVARSGGPVRRRRPESPAPVPGTLAVVQVQTGETLQQVAQRVAPDAPVGAGRRPDPRAQQARLGGGRCRADAHRADRVTVA